MRTIAKLWRAFLAPRPLSGAVMVATFADTPRSKAPAFMDWRRAHPRVLA